jgi:2-desacetyl-2-hydroxyethyl bacteriochlorophyllide A dehydrogenase
MTSKAVRFLGPEKCVFEDVVPAASLKAGEFLLETEFSVVSVGTELANYSGLDPGVLTPGSWNEYPSTPGYGSVGRVVEVASGSEEMEGMPKPGQRVFAFNSHSALSVGNVSQRFVVPLEEDDDGVLMTLIRMAGVSITTVRRAGGLQPGAVAAVVGLGVVGNFAAQLLQLAGLEVHAFEPDPYRAEVAREVGIENVIEAPVPTDFSAAGRERLGGGGADLVVEATGVSGLVGGATSLARYGGEVLLLGSPRAPYQADVTDLLRDIQLRGLTVASASEWTLAGKGSRRLHSDTWSIEENYRYLSRALASGRLKGRELVTKIVDPAQAPDVYRRLQAKTEGILSVVFDWRS